MSLPTAKLDAILARHAILTDKLAAGADGEAFASGFYERAVAATERLLKDTAALGLGRGFWAVAESGAASAWQSLETVTQGEGELGDRLDAVYSALRAKGDAARERSIIRETEDSLDEAGRYVDMSVSLHVVRKATPGEPGAFELLAADVGQGNAVIVRTADDLQADR